jgi:sensor c-di-GMP phosphodiesterase-like protein
MTTMTELDIADGLLRGEFLLHYQPKLSLVANRIVGAEALARWQRPGGTLLPPSAFISTAERTGMIKDLTLQLLACLLRELEGGWLDPNIVVSLNVTVQDIEDGMLTQALLAAIADGRLVSAALELEITETQALAGGQRARPSTAASADRCRYRPCHG